jgi:hypothetical protein
MDTTCVSRFESWGSQQRPHTEEESCVFVFDEEIADPHYFRHRDVDKTQIRSRDMSQLFQSSANIFFQLPSTHKQDVQLL